MEVWRGRKNRAGWEGGKGKGENRRIWDAEEEKMEVRGEEGEREEDEEWETGGDEMEGEGEITWGEKRKQKSKPK